MAPQSDANDSGDEGAGELEDEKQASAANELDEMKENKLPKRTHRPSAAPNPAKGMDPTVSGSYFLGVVPF